MAKDALVSDELAQKFASEKETAYTRWVRSEGLDIVKKYKVRLFASPDDSTTIVACGDLSSR